MTTIEARAREVIGHTLMYDTASTPDALAQRILAALSAQGFAVVPISDLEALPQAAYGAARGSDLSVAAAERAYLHLKSKVADLLPPPPAPEET